MHHSAEQPLPQQTFHHCKSGPNNTMSAGAAPIRTTTRPVIHRRASEQCQCTKCTMIRSMMHKRQHFACPCYAPPPAPTPACLVCTGLGAIFAAACTMPQRVSFTATPATGTLRPRVAQRQCCPIPSAARGKSSAPLPLGRYSFAATQKG